MHPSGRRVGGGLPVDRECTARDRNHHVVPAVGVRVECTVRPQLRPRQPYGRVSNNVLSSYSPSSLLPNFTVPHVDPFSPHDALSGRMPWIASATTHWLGASDVLRNT